MRLEGGTGSEAIALHCQPTEVCAAAEKMLRDLLHLAAWSQLGVLTRVYLGKAHLMVAPRAVRVPLLLLSTQHAMHPLPAYPQAKSLVVHAAGEAGCHA